MIRSGSHETTSIDPQVRRTMLSLSSQAWGISAGLTAGLLLFIATNLLVLRGGDVVGPHLGLLSIVFPGYRVSFGGSLIGFVYAFFFGYGMGRLVGIVYNAIARR